MRIAALILIFIACVLIGAGRYCIRRNRRAKVPRRRRSLAGWAMVGLGFLAMLMGVLLWP